MIYASQPRHEFKSGINTSYHASAIYMASADSSSPAGLTVRVAALYDIHSNLPALEAVLHDVSEVGVGCVVVGGDVIPGPMPREILDLLFNLDMPVYFIAGNGELGVLAQLGEPDPAAVTYWGTVW